MPFHYRSQSHFPLCIDLKINRTQNYKSVQEVSKQILAAWNLTSINDGAGSRIRTDDLLITNQLLYQLSYAGKLLQMFCLQGKCYLTPNCY